MRNSGISFCFTPCIKIGFCGCSQRDCMIYYKLDKPLNAEKILKDIQNLITKNHNNGDSVLVINIQKINNYTGDNPIPKITYEAEKES